MLKRFSSRGVIFLVIVFAAFTCNIMARAGGAGGSSSSGSYHSSSSFSHSSSSNSSSHSFSSHSGSFSSSESFGGLLAPVGGMVVGIGLFFVFIRIGSKSRTRGDNFIDFTAPPISSRPGKVPLVKSNTAERSLTYQKFISNNPQFNADQFIEKVQIAFYAVQEAWSVQNVATVRRFISDGMYQRFTTQFKMMSLLKQTNQLSNIIIKSIQIVAAKCDGNYESLDVQITASVDDRFVCDLDHNLDSGGAGQCFTEYWSFIRKHGIENKDAFSRNNCPACGGELPMDMGEVSQCSYCNSIVNSGSFDWVLSEITQEDDYLMSESLDRESKLELLGTFYETYNDFSVQLVEDKASNGFLQLMTACATKNPAIIRRFVSDLAFEKLKLWIPDETVVYNRIYLNDVTVIGAQSDGDKNTLVVSIKKSSQRVKISANNIVQIMDRVIHTESHFVLLSRSAHPQENKGTLYLHRCPACGAPNSDSLDMHCTYCDAVFNDPQWDWIIEDILTPEEYRQYFLSHKKQFEHLINPKLLDETYNAHDYALNNIMLIIAADGKYDQDERVMIELIAKKWNYQIENIEPLFSMANSGRLSIRMPENRRERRKVFQLMETVALADGKITQEESAILEGVRQQYLQDVTNH